MLSIDGWKTYLGAALLALAALNHVFSWVTPEVEQAVLGLGGALGLAGLGHKVSKLHGAIVAATSDGDDRGDDSGPAVAVQIAPIRKAA